MSREAFEAWWKKHEQEYGFDFHNAYRSASKAYEAAERATAQRCREAVLDAGGDNASYHADAIAREFGLDATDARKG